MENESKVRMSPKRLIIDISEEDHMKIKTKALLRNITIRMWVMRALREQLKKEQEYE